MCIYQNAGIEIRIADCWVFLGPEGSGKSRLARELAASASSLLPPERIIVSSAEDREALLEEERLRDESDFLNEIDPGRSVLEYLLEISGAPIEEIRECITDFGLGAMSDQGLKYLSSGELSRLITAGTCLRRPQLLILDDPFANLDPGARLHLIQRLTTLHDTGCSFVFMLSREDEIPNFVTHAGFLRDGQIILQGPRAILHSPEYRQLASLHYQLPKQLPGERQNNRPDRQPTAGSQHSTPLLEMRTISVRYHGSGHTHRDIFRNFSFTVQEGQHWMITGANGIGKSTLLTLITGDHPQCYANDIRIFGQKRGSGESIWDIKKEIGMLSSALQNDYRVTVSVLGAMVSGFFDSIGVYCQPARHQMDSAREWLELAGMAKLANRPYQELSYGQRRLVLIMRAMIKHPRLLILDEPCQGLDAAHRAMILQLTQIIASRGSSTILYVTHHPQDRVPSIRCHLELRPEICIRD